MRMELAKPPNQVDKQALMRLVGGSVIPQVNGGAMEIAECFLSRVNMQTQEMHLMSDPEKLAKRRAALAGEMLTFLTLCRELVYRTRHVLHITAAMLAREPVEGDDGELAQENGELTWQREVEKGLENMKAFMKPMVLQFDVPGAEEFFGDKQRSALHL
uniref:DOCKER Lobe C domain-containing protein n=1 Tax=Phaeomonas parva TaxID=124430 RepID=A0A7S1XJ45_9STRA|mmetsp:Transcript_11223/g.34143  ORF Transcript_11223/g.34143 Transcript_11223/m.34143 type:complete len:159 (+) Transcript_11223:592-1068(+)